jgi:predicted nucleic acid-binding protein
MDITHSHVILDACCVINLCASGHLSDILTTIPATVAIAEVMHDDELLKMPLVDVRSDNEPEDIASIIEQGLLQIVPFESEDEQETFVNIAAVLGDDGESATIALAIHRDWAIATDDKSALNYVRRESGNLQTITTPDLVKHWSETRKPAPGSLRDALTNIRLNGHYDPPREHPLRDWWHFSML